MAEKQQQPAESSQNAYTNPSSVPEHLTVAGDTLFFVADDGLHGRELWRYDSTGQSSIAGDIRPGPESSNPRQLTSAQGGLYFVADAEEKKVRLWGWDKEQQQVKMADQDQTLPDGVSYGLKGVGGGALYFFLQFSDGNIELRTLAPGAWNSELTTTIIPEDPKDFITGIITEDNMFYYLSHSGLWCVDTQKKTKKPLAQVYYMTGAGDNWAILRNRILFGGTSPEDTGSELWISDSTPEGAKLVKDIFPGKDSSLIMGFFLHGDTVFFHASNGKSGRELWKTNGTPEGTVLVKDINPGEASSEPHEFQSIGQKIYFFADDGAHGIELWKSDGTEQGTKLACDLYPGVQGSTPWSPAVFQDRIYFCAKSPDSGEEIWSIGPEDQSPRLLKDIVAGAGDTGPDNLTVFSNKLVFTCSDQIHGEELWISDGTETGTLLAADIAVPSKNPSSSPTQLTACGDTLYFVADDPLHGRELWMSDGTEEGTQLVCDIASGREDSVPDHLTASGKRLFFTAEQPATGRELWVTDPLTKSAALVRDIHPGPLGSNPYCLTALANTLFFLANDAAGGFRPWRSDGTGAGTWAIEETGLDAGTRIKKLVTFQNHAYFYTKGNNSEVCLWRIMPEDKNAGMLWRLPPEFRVWDPARIPARTAPLFPGCLEAISPEEAYLIPAIAPVLTDAKTVPIQPTPKGIRNTSTYFVANTDHYGAELWRTDGTIEGTQLVVDAFPGPGSSSPSRIVFCDDTLYFIAESPQEGRVLWRLRSNEPAATIVHPISGSSEWPAVQPSEIASLPDSLLVVAPHPTSNGIVGLGSILNTQSQGFGLIYEFGFSQHTQPRQLVGVDKHVFFTVDDGIHGEELWVMEASKEKPHLVKDIFSKQ